jgi:hypothetical protein
MQTVGAKAGTFTYTYNSGLAGATTASSLVAKVALPNGAYITEVYDNDARMTTNCLYNSGGTPLDYFACAGVPVSVSVLTICTCSIAGPARKCENISRPTIN